MHLQVCKPCDLLAPRHQPTLLDRESDASRAPCASVQQLQQQTGCWEGDWQVSCLLAAVQLHYLLLRLLLLLLSVTSSDAS